MAGHPKLSWDLRTERLIAESANTVIVGGFPCQDISLAGEGAGLAGGRSGLIWPLLRTIRLVRPPRAVLENVAALLGRGLDKILGRMAEIGYDAEWHCIPASAVGAPHQRDRIWIIATDARGEQHESGSAPISGEIAQELSGAFAGMADTDRPWEQQPQGCEREQRGWPGYGSPAFTDCDANRARLQASWPQPNGANGRFTGREFAAASWWTVEPALGRVADGVPARVDRLRSLGNAVVPQIPEIIGRAILAADRAY